jgi:hypothetical protein
LSTNIPEFAKINEMPIPLDIRRIAEGDGIEAAFVKTNQAKYPESNSYTQSDRSSRVIKLPCDLYTILGTQASSLLARLPRVGPLHQFGYDITTFLYN